MSILKVSMLLLQFSSRIRVEAGVWHFPGVHSYLGHSAGWLWDGQILTTGMDHRERTRCERSESLYSTTHLYTNRDHSANLSLSSYRYDIDLKFHTLIFHLLSSCVHHLSMIWYLIPSSIYNSNKWIRETLKSLSRLKSVKYGIVIFDRWWKNW